MNIYVLTIHNPKFSFGPNMRLQSFINSLKDKNVNFILPKFASTHSKGKTINTLFEILFYLIFNRKKINLIHVVTPPAYPGLIAVFAKKILKIPYIVDVGDPAAENFATSHELTNKNPLFKILKRIDNIIYKNADHLILTSPILDQYTTKASAKSTILSAIDNKEKVPENFKLPKNKKCVYIGNYGPLQNLEYVVGIFTKAIKKNPAISLDIIGSGNKEAIQTIINEAQCQNKIRIFNPIPSNEIPKRLKQYTLGIVSLDLKPNLDYAIPTKLLTHLFYGLPTFGPAGKACKHIIERSEGGKIITEYNERNDTSALLNLLNNRSTLEKHSKNALNYAKHHLTFEHFGKKAALIYNKAKK